MASSADGQQELVLSDVHVGTCPPGQSVWSTRFVCLASEAEKAPVAAASSLDRDGDLDLSRPSRPRTALNIAHRLETPISTCGTQIWRGACLLADYLLNFPEVVRHHLVLELGAGTGLVSVVAAGAAGSSVIATDVCQAALSLACRNAAGNLPTWQQHPDAAGPSSSSQGSLLCRGLDWSSFLHTQGGSLNDVELLELLNSQPSMGSKVTTAAAPAAGAGAETATAPAHTSVVHPTTTAPAAQAESGSGGNTWAWQAGDLQQLSRVDVLLAADVVYEPVLTEAFMHTAHALMTWLRKQQQQPQQQDKDQRQQQQQQGQPVGCRAASQPTQDMQPYAGQPSPHLQQQQLPATGPVLYVAAEKRYNFTLRDMDAVATAWDHFLSFVTPVGSSQGPHNTATREHARESSYGEEGLVPLFVGQPVEWRSMPQLLTPYDRCAELELWRLWLPA